MAFQFMCPHGHLLQAEESQAGQQCHCPECGVLMLIPSPLGSDPPPHDSGLSPEQPAEPAQTPGDAFPACHDAADFSGIDGTASTQQAPASEFPSQAPKVLHIPCPNGHVLETPDEMIGQDALCPFCNTQFRLRSDDSIEHRQEREREEERRQERAARAWLNWSIVAAVVVIFGVILLLLVRAS